MHDAKPVAVVVPEEHASFFLLSFIDSVGLEKGAGLTI